MVIRDSLCVNANVLAFSKWSQNPSTFQQATLNAVWNSLVWMRICCMWCTDNNDCLFTFWANSEWSCERHTGLFAICCLYLSAFYSLMWMHLKTLGSMCYQYQRASVTIADFWKVWQWLYYTPCRSRPTTYLKREGNIVSVCKWYLMSARGRKHYCCTMSLRLSTHL